MRTFFEQYGKMIIIIISIAALIGLAGLFIFKFNFDGQSFYDKFLATHLSNPTEDEDPVTSGRIKITRGEWLPDNTCIVTATDTVTGVTKELKVRGAELYSRAYSEGYAVGEGNVEIEITEGSGWSSDYKKTITATATGGITETYEIDGSQLAEDVKKSILAELGYETTNWHENKLTLTTTATTISNMTDASNTSSDSIEIDATPVYEQGKADGKGDVTVSQTISKSDWTDNKITVTANAGLSNGKNTSNILEIDATPLYEQGKADGRASVSLSDLTLSVGDWNNKKILVTGELGSNDGRKTVNQIEIDATELYNKALQNASEAVTLDVLIDETGWILNRKTLGFTTKLSNGYQKSSVLKVDGSPIYDKGYKSVETDLTVTKADNTRYKGEALSSSDWVDNKLKIFATSLLTNKKEYKAVAEVDATPIYDKGFESVKITRVAHSTWDANNKCTVTAYLDNGKTVQYVVDASSVYQKGWNKGDDDSGYKWQKYNCVSGLQLVTSTGIGFQCGNGINTPYWMSNICRGCGKAAKPGDVWKGCHSHYACGNGHICESCWAAGRTMDFSWSDNGSRPGCVAQSYQQSYYVTAYSCGTTYITTVKDKNPNAYPANGRHTDGYWYIRQPK